MNKSQQNLTNQKQSYQRPQLKKYGKLADITFNTVGSGTDGGVGFLRA